jgi:hypothetical protein
VSAPLPETARGKRPGIFTDPASEALLAMLLELTRDQWITKNRLATLEHWATNAVTAATVPWSEAYRLPPEAEAALAAERDAFVKRLLAPAEAA